MSIRIAVVGSSGHWDLICHGLSKLPDIAVCAVAPGCEQEDITGLLNCQAISCFKPAIYSNYLSMLAEQKPEIVCVNPFYYLNAEVIIASLKAGSHVFSEKPLSLDLESLQEIRELQSQKGLQIGMMLSFRTDGKFCAARKLVQSGAIGQPLMGYAQKSYKLGLRPDFYKKRQTFGGIIPWVGIHAIDWFRWVSGVEYASVSAYHKNCNSEIYPELEDLAGCLFELDNGGIAVMSFDYLRPAAAKNHGDDRLRLVGSSGCLEILESKVSLINAGGICDIEPDRNQNDLFEDFIHSVIFNNGNNIVTTEDAISVTRIALETRKAADSGSKINLKI